MMYGGGFFFFHIGMRFKFNSDCICDFHLWSRKYEYTYNFYNLMFVKITSNLHLIVPI